MTTFNSYVYSKAAASRIFAKKVISVEVERDRVKCQLWDKTCRTTTTARFKEHFAEHRKEQGKWLTAYRCGNEYHVADYVVKVYADHLSCNCKDWLIQKLIGINRPTCKHCYAVLNKLGCNSLAEYLEGKKIKARESSKATNQQDETTSQTSSSLPQLPTVSQWVLYWETYGRDRATGEPLKTATTICKNRKPTDLEIWDMRKLAHSKGFKLVSIEQMKQTA